MQIRNVKYYFREAITSMRRNGLLSIATVSTVAICILILGAAVLITLNTSTFLQNLESDVEIMAFLDNEIDKSQIENIIDKIKAIEGVESVIFISREEALNDMQDAFGENNYDLKSTLGENPLPHSLEIKAVNPHNVPNLAEQVGNIAGIYKVNYGQGVVEKLFTTARWIRIISIIFIVLLATGAVFLIATTIRLAIFSRRKEIYLMKLIGSTDWFIRWPFFIEGIALGAAGAILSIVILAAAYGSLINNVGTVFFMPLLSSGRELICIYFYLFAAGAGLGILGTGFSINRFMDV